jgi:hypothetical protein
LGFGSVCTYIKQYTQDTPSLIRPWASGYILLFTSSVFFHCFSNSSSHGTRNFACWGCTGTLTLWCSTVQYVVFPSRHFISPRIMAICFPTPTTLLWSRTFVPIGTAFRYEMLSVRVTPPMNSQKPGRASGHRAVVVDISKMTPAAPPCMTSTSSQLA